MDLASAQKKNSNRGKFEKRKKEEVQHASKQGERLLLLSIFLFLSNGGPLQVQRD